ncbi:ATP-binding protein [Streptomyces sp. NPDC001009]
MTLERAGAFTSVAAELTVPHLELALAAERSCVRTVRRIVIQYMTFLRQDAALLEDVELAVSELVTNAVEYGHDSVVLRLRCDDGELRIEVKDDNPVPATLGDPADDDESGRGLWIVAVLARDWGVSEDGRTTWCTFRIAGGRGS